MLLCLAALLTGGVCALDVTAGAVSLSIDDLGRVTETRCAGDGLGGGPGGFSIRDAAVEETYGPVTGSATAVDGGLRFEGRNPAGTLAVTASLVPEDHWLTIRGEVRNLDDADRAVSLRFDLPVDCEGWTWSKRLHKDERLPAGRVVHLGTRIALGSGTSPSARWPRSMTPSGPSAWSFRWT